LRCDLIHFLSGERLFIEEIFIALPGGFLEQFVLFCGFERHRGGLRPLGGIPVVDGQKQLAGFHAVSFLHQNGGDHAHRPAGHQAFAVGPDIARGLVNVIDSGRRDGGDFDPLDDRPFDRFFRTLFLAGGQ